MGGRSTKTINSYFLDDHSKSKVKCIVVLNALGVALSSLISWVLIEWAKAALLKSQQGLLPLPAFTNAVFKLQPALIAPVAIFLLISVLSVRSGSGKRSNSIGNQPCTGYNHRNQ